MIPKKLASPHQRITRGEMGKAAERGCEPGLLSGYLALPAADDLTFFWIWRVVRRITHTVRPRHERSVTNVRRNKHVKFSLPATRPRSRPDEAPYPAAPQTSRSTSLWPSLWVTALHPLLEWPAFFYGLTESFVNERLIRFPDPA